MTLKFLVAKIAAPERNLKPEEIEHMPVFGWVIVCLFRLFFLGLLLIPVASCFYAETDVFYKCVAIFGFICAMTLTVKHIAEIKKALQPKENTTC
jgi:hypothetical protein